MNPPIFISSEVYRAVGYPANHPLAIARIAPVMDLCAALGWLPQGYVDSPAADAATLTRFHDAAYVAALREASTLGRVQPWMRERHGLGTLENPVFPGLYDRAALSVGGSILAADHVAAGGIAFHAPGGTHHGFRDHASGFCFFNDPVFAILTLLDQGKRVLYVDLDAHHGDGVEAAFAGDRRVRTISVHEEGRWPFTGLLQDEAGGTGFNLPVPARMNDNEFALIIDGAVLSLARGFAPDAVVITMGADALAGDPLSSLAISNVALWRAVESLVACVPSAVVLGGGGYNPWTLARAWAGMWGRLSGQPIPDHLPAAAKACLRGLTCDLVDEDEMQADWLETLADAPRPGPVRREFHELVAALRQRETETA